MTGTVDLTYNRIGEEMKLTDSTRSQPQGS